MVGARRNGTKLARNDVHRTERKEKRTRYDTIHKLRRSVFRQSLAVSHPLTTNNNNLNETGVTRGSG